MSLPESPSDMPSYGRQPRRRGGGGTLRRPPRGRDHRTPITAAASSKREDVIPSATQLSQSKATKALPRCRYCRDWQLMHEVMTYSFGRSDGKSQISAGV